MTADPSTLEKMDYDVREVYTSDMQLVISATSDHTQSNSIVDYTYELHFYSDALESSVENKVNGMTIEFTVTVYETSTDYDSESCTHYIGPFTVELPSSGYRESYCANFPESLGDYI